MPGKSKSVVKKPSTAPKTKAVVAKKVSSSKVVTKVKKAVPTGKSVIKRTPVAPPAPQAPALKPAAMSVKPTSAVKSASAAKPPVAVVKAPPAVVVRPVQAAVVKAVQPAVVKAVQPPTPSGTNTLATLTDSEVAPSSAYGKALKFLATLSDYEHRRIVRYTAENFNLDRMRNLLKKLGDPHTKFRSVHVAGTKGKGSTCAMIASMVRANDYKVGLYTSPHLMDIRERIQVNGEMISRDDFARLVKVIEPVVMKMKPLPTYFDVLTAIAFMYFAEQKIELGVIETGLGGRLDSTNVITPEVTCVTAISNDHMAQLGGTLEKIAGEKAGIFKKDIPAVTCLQSDPAIEKVFVDTAAKVGAPFDICGKTIEFSYRFESSRLAGPHFRLSLTTPTSKFEHVAVPMVGEHQAINCGLALSVIDKLRARGIAMTEGKCLEGLAKTYIAGRMELVSTLPRIIVDGAHNAASVDALMKSIGQHIPYDSMVLIFGCCSDKDVKGMLEKIACGADKVIFTRVNNIRTAEPEELAQKYNEMFGKMCQVAPSLEAALSIARRAVSKEDMICITGSFYLVGEAKRLFAKAPATPALSAN